MLQRNESEVSINSDYQLHAKYVQFLLSQAKPITYTKIRIRKNFVTLVNANNSLFFEIDIDCPSLLKVISQKYINMIKYRISLFNRVYRISSKLTDRFCVIENNRCIFSSDNRLDANTFIKTLNNKFIELYEPNLSIPILN